MSAQSEEAPRGGTRFVTSVLGDRVAFDLEGPAGAPGALFIQGAGLSRAANPVPAETARLLAERGYQASVHDRVGRGESAAEGAISLERELSAIAAVADQFGGPVVLVGHSSGCAIAMLAADRVDNLAGLVLWEAPFDQFPGGAPAWWGSVVERIDGGDLETAVSRYMVDMPDEWIEELRQVPEYPGLIHSWMPDGTALAEVEGAGLEASLGERGEPVLALIGSETFPGMAEAAARIAQAAPRGSAEELDGAWHDWDPQAMATRLERMLAGSTA